ncbi:hypothetical protein ACIFOT_07395 [Neobacillus sp. NRS-1170]|uniref:hypothetical protein n=1 Tax=Neobacillus sp. NRS-1170 TaxID=3233898 RepID=UPI003D2CC6AB
MSANNKYQTEAEVANRRMSQKFKDYSAREYSEGNSEAEMANHDIQEQFYGRNEDNLAPFHVDVNNPPIKK